MARSASRALKPRAPRAYVDASIGAAGSPTIMLVCWFAYGQRGRQPLSPGVGQHRGGHVRRPAGEQHRHELGLAAVHVPAGDVRVLHEAAGAVHPPVHARVAPVAVREDARLEQGVVERGREHPPVARAGRPRTRTRPSARAQVRCAPARTRGEAAPAALGQVGPRAGHAHERDPHARLDACARGSRRSRSRRRPPGPTRFASPPAGPAPLHVPWAAKGWLKRALKYTR